MIEKKYLEKAPIVVIGFNRPLHLRDTLDALSKSVGFKDSQIYIFLDGARDHTDEPECRKVRAVCKNFSSDKPNVKLEIRNENLGLASNIRISVSEVLKRHKKAIILEDDLFVSSSFIEYMNEGLRKYQDNKKIWHISGWSPNFSFLSEEIYCSEKMFCWGWATWQDRWHYFSKNTKRMISEWSSKDIHKFNYESNANHWNQVLFNHLKINDTWAIFWAATIFENNGLCINPKKSLVINIGFDGSGVHYLSDKQKNLDQKMIDKQPSLELDSLEERIDVRVSLSQFLMGNKTKLEIFIIRILTYLNIYNWVFLGFFRLNFIRQIILRLRP